MTEKWTQGCGADMNLYDSDDTNMLAVNLDSFASKRDSEEPQAAPRLEDYDTIVLMFSGGKDSVACFLHLLDMGVPKEKIELWHHDIDGKDQFMDWPSTPSYCKAFANAFGVPLYSSGKVGGFRREMLRQNAPTAPVWFETPEGEVRQVGGTSNKLGTRRKFPQVTANLSQRWCSAYLKVDVSSAAINNQDRFLGRKTLVVTGERAEESAARAKYSVFEPHRCDNRNGTRRARHVDHWRPVHGWTETQVWAILERYRVNPAPSYRLGWGRLSCMTCIFGSADQWASARKIAPLQFMTIADYERQFGTTIHRTKTVIMLADAGKPYDMDAATVREAISHEFTAPIILKEGEWKLPKGAFGESCGPV